MGAIDDTPGDTEFEFDRDVVIVGGGPAGCSAGVFCARDGLETLIYDRGRSSIRRCAYLENYLGFPAGIDVETLYELYHDHAETAGCEIRADLVESVERRDGEGFRLTPQEGDPVTARRVIAATRYDGEYLRGLDDAMFETHVYDGEERERFDREYPDRDGSTPIEGLYVASPSAEADMQAIAAAGRGARVARRAIADARIDEGWWEAVAAGVDWVRRDAERDGEWTDRDRWVEHFDEHYGADAPVDPASDRYRRVREASIDESLASYISPAEIETRTATGHERLASHLDPERVVAALPTDALLESVPDEDLLAAAAAIESGGSDATSETDGSAGAVESTGPAEEVD
ncbi:NAD(P)/FAD-dependent oxidoreductase [Halovivax limisalsi]|uniref:NAD(P)/FAD-dependent oxidoreductase n=1 Tax=Halovivax limisalsi TaxID=1453760 RepID=UPI001FFCA70A|nr:NAD(P)/FAD-dependent oxidoreductase [Halovivax limisalsi]